MGLDAAEDAQVTVSIYDTRGDLVRRLDLGERTAGAYRTRDLAAYWDGRDARDEAVATGVYVAEFVAGTRRASRRIVVKK